MNYRQTRKSSLKQKIRFTFLLILLLGAAIYFGYAFKIKEQIASLTPIQRNVLLIGHAGSGFFSPLNPFNPLPPSSFASIVKAIKDGADGVEIDVHLSKDGVPVLYHDETLNSMSAGKGLIEDLPASKVVGLAYTGGNPYDLFQNEKIISLETMLQEFQQYPAYPYLHIDLRHHGPNRHAYFAGQVMGLLRRYKYPVEKVSIVYVKPDLLLAFKKEEPRITLLLDIDQDFEKGLAIARINKLQGLVANAKGMDEAKVKKAREQNLQVILFGPKAKSSILKALKLEPDAIEVNNVPAMRQMITSKY
ncbi:glycerophosphodiester phosphodiesterase [Adhaeribacter aquaticus]|uniref:glycerophosphodiester phosphodiesterase n=1 Tax=Adhaeribacter aquaticus TaxID=299567 RepID=UPI000418D4C0|nr:glycerophosphodiester phosphodiesterase family protein [Adhaeribacter aquaticus]